MTTLFSTHCLMNDDDEDHRRISAAPIGRLFFALATMIVVIILLQNMWDLVGMLIVGICIASTIENDEYKMKDYFERSCDPVLTQHSFLTYAISQLETIFLV
jgi:hypothetical protein